MALKFPPEQIAQLKIFVSALKSAPQILHTPELSFLKEYIESLGGKVPPKVDPPSDVPPTKTEPPKAQPEPAKKADSDSDDIPDYEEEEMDYSLISNEGIVDPESEPLPEIFASTGKEISESDSDKADEFRSQAMSHMSEGQFAEAVESFTQAIKCNPESAMLYAKRASALMKLKRVKAVIADCDEAISRNPDSALAHKLRGRAYRLLGDWLKAAGDLRKACKLDCDEQAIEWLSEVSPNANKIEEHQRTQQRKRGEVEIEQKKQRVRRARKEHQRAAAKEKESDHFQMPPGGMGGMGGMGDFGSFFSDPDIMEGLQDPELRKVFTEMNMDPESLSQYQDNPKVRNFMEKLQRKFGGGGADPFGGGSPFGGAGPFGGAAPGGDSSPMDDFEMPQTTPADPKPASKSSTLEEVD